LFISYSRTFPYSSQDFLFEGLIFFNDKTKRNSSKLEAKIKISRNSGFNFFYQSAGIYGEQKENRHHIIRNFTVKPLCVTH